MKVDKILDSRFELALERLTEGQSFVFKGIEFWVNRENTILEIRIPMSSERHLSEDQIDIELEHGKEIFEYLMTQSKKFSTVTADLDPRFSFVFDYGTGAVEVGYFSNGKVVWSGTSRK